MAGEDIRSFITYRDVLEWIEDFELTHKVVVAWVLTLARKRSTGEVIQEVAAVVRQKTDDGSYRFVMQARKPFGKGSDHATLPGAMIACINEADKFMQDREGSRVEDDPRSGRNPYV